MEIGEALELCGEDDLLELFLLAHAEAVAQVAGAELAALELLDNFPLAKGLRQKLGRRGVVQAEDEMHVEIVEEGLFLVRAVDVRHRTEILVGKDEKAAFGAAHGQEIEDAGHLGQGAKLIDHKGDAASEAVGQGENFAGHDVDDEGHQRAEDGIVLADVHEKEIPPVRIIANELAE